MAKQDTTDAIKAANGTTLDPNDYTGKELDELLTLAKQGDTGKAEFDRKVTEYKGKSVSTAAATAEAQSPQEEDTTGKIRVKVTDGKGTGSYIHPTDKKLLRRGGTPVWVTNDDWTDEMIRNKYLTEARK